MSIFPAGVQPDVPHAHAQRQEAVHVSRLRQRVLPELRPEETLAETARRHLPTAADRATTTLAGRTAAVSRPWPRGVVRLRVPGRHGPCDVPPGRRVAAEPVSLLSAISSRTRARIDSETSKTCA